MTQQTDHSPAPWSFDGPKDNIHVRLASDPNMRVCFMTSDGPAEANARLIASAPDMLAALTALLSALDADDPWDREHVGQYQDAITQARAAVAKAVADGELAPTKES